MSEIVIFVRRNSAYCLGKNQCIYTTTGDDPNSGTSILNVSPFAGEAVQTYIGFMSADGKDISNSYFTGQLTITA